MNDLLDATGTPLMFNLSFNRHADAGCCRYTMVISNSYSVPV